MTAALTSIAARTITLPTVLWTQTISICSAVVLESESSLPFLLPLLLLSSSSPISFFSIFFSSDSNSETMRRHFFSILSIASKNPNTSPKPLHHLNLISPPKHRIPPHQSVSAHGFSTAAQESKPAPTDTVSAIVDKISGLTLLEVSDLTELLPQQGINLIKP